MQITRGLFPCEKTDLEALTETVKREFPENVAKTIEKADAICRHEFDFLGRQVSFGETIDWHWCPESGGSWPNVPSHEYISGAQNYYREDRPGDVKYPWELNRHQYFVTLAKAFLYTGEDRYAREVCAQMRDWVESNPYGQGVNWVSTMEAGLRLISWTNAFNLLQHSEVFQCEGRDLCVVSIYQHALHINGHLTTDWLVRNNHILGETAALAIFGTAFPAFRDAARIRNRALRLFAHELERQVFADGVNAEQSTGYHRFVLEFATLVAGMLDERNAMGRMGPMTEYEVEVGTPDGSGLGVGDCDDGEVGLPNPEWETFTVCEVRLPSPVHPSTPSGRTGEGRLAAISEVHKPTTVARGHLCREGGQAVLRAREGQTFVFVRCGEFGLGGEGACGHSHADILAPVIYWRGQPLAVDSGTYGYLCETKWRDHFRSTAAHNTLAPRGVEQAEMFPLKDWGRVPVTHVTEWETDATRTVLAAEMRARDEYRHRRRFELDADRLEIRDELELMQGKAPVDLDWLLHLHPELDATVAGATITIERGGAPFAALRYDGYDDVAILDTWYSPRYGVKVPNRCIRLTRRGTSVQSTVTITDPA